MYYFQIKLNSDMTEINKVNTFVEEIIHKCDIDDQYYGVISTPLIEAAKNAIIHGNKQDSSKFVLISMQTKQNQLQFSVEDQGNGFDYLTIFNQPIEQTKKYGLKVINQLASKVEFMKNGSVINYTVEVPMGVKNAEKRANILSKEKEELAENLTKVF